jgi:hypothetical protein
MRQTFRIGCHLKLGWSPGDAPWTKWDGLAFERDPRMELEGAVLNLQVVLLAQFVDPSLADVAPRSNEIAEDQETGCHASSV